MTSRPRSSTRAFQSCLRSTSGSWRAAARSALSPAAPKPRMMRSKSEAVSVSAASATATSMPITAASVGRTSTPAASTSVRATGASERSATSIVQSERGCSWQARAHFFSRTWVAPFSSSGARRSVSPSRTSTMHEPHVPRPPHAPTTRTPLRRAAWNTVSPPRPLTVRPSCGNDSAKISVALMLTPFPVSQPCSSCATGNDRSATIARAEDRCQRRTSPRPISSGSAC